MSQQFCLAFALAIITSTVALAGGDRSALWKIVHGQCLPNDQAHHDPAPCVRVDRNVGYVILKDRAGVAQFLLLPTRRISGIESPALLALRASNYWADAWRNRTYVALAAKHNLAWDAVGLAVNSSLSRSQDELHIHIDCLQPDVRALLAAHAAEIGRRWAELSFDLHGERYVARRLAAADLAKQNPFGLLACGVPGTRQNMARETLVVAGVTFAPGNPGFVLLAARADPAKGRYAHGDALLDRSCALATQ
jgi:CDP-diacylglycerol pyrophosphatase